MPEIFINYRTGDGEETAVAFKLELSHRFGADKVFFASDSIKPGEAFPQALLKNVRSSKVLLAIIGSRWLARDDGGHRRIDDANDWVRREIVEAISSGDRLRAEDLPKDIACLSDLQSLLYDHREAKVFLANLSEVIRQQIPGLVDVTETMEEDPEPIGIRNSVQNSTGVSIQAGDYTHTQYGGIGIVAGGNSGTIVTDPRGPMHTGSGNQYNLPQRDGE
jgi:hypothetical protein